MNAQVNIQIRFCCCCKRAMWTFEMFVLCMNDLVGFTGTECFKLFPANLKEK